MEPLLNNIIKAFGWSIFHSLWQGAIVYGLLFTAVMFIPRLTAQTKHNLAFGSICITFISFCITFCTIFEVPKTSVSAALHSSSIIFSNYMPSMSERISNQAEQFFPMLVTLYTIGLLLQMAVLIHGYGKLNALKKSAKEIVPASWMEIFETTIKQLKIRRKVSFFLSDQVNVPLVLGFLKPVVLFPVALANNMDLNQVEAILIHELSHIRRNDYLLNLVKTAIETILFFNPFIWLSGRFIHIEREHACDDLVVAFTGTPVTYAHALLKLELLQDKNSPAIAMAATGKPQYLYQRIKRITNMKANYMNVRQQILLITVTFSTIISLAWINPDQSKAAVKRIVAKVASKIDVFEPLNSHSALQQELAMIRAKELKDTTKKKTKLTFVTEDAKGNQIIYTSVDELPDSLKNDLRGKGIFFDGKKLQGMVTDAKGKTWEIDSGLTLRMPLKIDGKEFKSIRDSAFIAGLSPKVKELLVNLRGPDAQEKLRILGLESRATADAFVKKFNTQEEKAKWTKLQVDLRKNSDEFIKKFNTPEEKARLMQLVQDAQRSVYQIDPIIVKGYPSNAVTGLKVDTTKRIKLRVNGKNYEDEMKLLMTPEYQELRKKFETEVNELRKKKGLEDNKN